MRRTLEILMAVLTLLLFSTAFVSCRRNEARLREVVVSRFADGFTCTAQVSFEGGNYTIQVTRPSAQECEMSFTQPAELSSLSFDLSGDGLKVKFSGLEATVDPSSVPQSAIFNAVLDVFNAAGGASAPHAKTAGGKVILTGRTAAGNYTLTLNPDLTPKSLEFPALKLKASFSDFQFS